MMRIIIRSTHLKINYSIPVNISNTLNLPNRSCEILVLGVRDVLAGLRIEVFLGQSKVHQIDHVGLATAGATDADVLGLDVPEKSRR